MVNFSKDFNYHHEGDYLYPAEYYQFRQASTLNTFKIELLCNVDFVTVVFFSFSKDQ